MNTVLKRKWHAFSLPELLVVLVINRQSGADCLPNLNAVIPRQKY